MDPLPTYVVKLVTKADTTLEHVEVSSLGFFRQMSSISRQTSVVFKLRGSRHAGASKEQSTTTLRDFVEHVSVPLRHTFPLATQGQAQGGGRYVRQRTRYSDLCDCSERSN
jgi:hypothetical protein